MAVKITVDKMADIIKAISELGAKDVLVGIPDSAPEREDGPISNAQIGYIQETGSPANNLPARPFLVPGVAEVQGKCAERLKKGATAALSGNLSGAESSLNAAGLTAQNSVKAKINSNIAPELSPETIRNRNKSRKTKSLRKSEKDYLKALDSGTSAADAQSAAGIVSLINTGQLRNSITFVVRKK
jgi:hypothetical protein